MLSERIKSATVIRDSSRMLNFRPNIRPKRQKIKHDLFWMGLFTLGECSRAFRPNNIMVRRDF